MTLGVQRQIDTEVLVVSTITTFLYPYYGRGGQRVRAFGEAKV